MFSSLRSRLVMLVLLAVLPALVLAFVQLREQKRLAVEQVHQDAARLAQIIAREEEQLFQETRQLVISMSRLKEVQTGAPEACQATLAQFLAQYPQLGNAGVAGLGGEVTCSVFALSDPVSLAGQPYFARALATGDVAVGGYQLDPITGKPALPFAVAIPNPNGGVQKVLFASLDLAWLNQSVPESLLPEGGGLVLADNAGRILILWPDISHWIGASLADLGLNRLAQASPGIVEEAGGPDGISRLYAVSAVHLSGPESLSLGVSVPTAAAFQSLDAQIQRQQMIWVILTLAVLGLAVLGGEFLFVRRVRTLLRSVELIHSGLPAGNTPLLQGSSEISRLAHHFDRMSQHLEQKEMAREAEETRAEQRNRDLAALNEVITAVSSYLELPEVLAQLKREVASRLDIPGGIIFLIDEEAPFLYLEAAWGIPSAVLSRLRRFPVSAYHYSQVIHRREILLSPDFRQVEAYGQSGLSDARPAWQSFLSVPLQAKGESLGVLDLFCEAPNAFHPDQVTLFSALGQQVGVVIQNARLFDQVRAGRQRLQMLSQQLLEVQERERRHISRELHDEIGQSLTALKVNLQSVLRLPGASTHTRYIEESISIVERVLQQVRDLSLDLRPSLLDDLGIVSALRWYIDRQGQRAGFQAEFTAAPPTLRLTPELETVIFRVVQEALTNVIRHAVASHVAVKLAVCNGELELTVRDDGIGFNLEAIRAHSTGPTSLGLLGMQERVQLVGGRFEIKSDPASGTEIRATFSLQPDLS